MEICSSHHLFCFSLDIHYLFFVGVCDFYVILESLDILYMLLHKFIQRKS